jgi:hypothetical protein
MENPVLLKNLFAQYDTDNGPRFASRFMKRVGNWCIGSLASHGLGHLRKDLQASYFYKKEDRHLPDGPEALEEWEMQSILVAQFRELQAPQVARAAFYALLVFNFAMVALAVAVRTLTV